MGQGGTRDGRGGGPIVGVAERRGPEKEMNPELRLKLTLKRQAQEENQCRRIMKGQRWGWRERLGKITVPEVKGRVSSEGAQVTMSKAMQRLPFEGLRHILWT